MVESKPQEDISAFLDDPEEILQLDTDQLINAFEAFLGRRKKVSEIRKNYENVQKRKITSEERVSFIKMLFRQQPDAVYSFRETVKDSQDKYDIALSFTSIMEMVKQRQVRAEQKALFGDIKVAKGERFDQEEENNDK